MQVLLYAPRSAFSDALQASFAGTGDRLHRVDAVDEIETTASYYETIGVLLDARIDTGAAVTWLRNQRRRGNADPAILLVDGPVAAHEIEAWLEHADDIVRLPADAREIMARLRAVLRRQAGQPSAAVTVDAVTLNSATRTVSVAGRAVHLTGKEWHILEALFLRPKTVVTKEMLLNHVYGGMDEPELKIIDVFVCKLRKKLTAAGARPDFIATVWGRGYSIAEEARRSDRGLRQVEPGALAAA